MDNVLIETRAVWKAFAGPPVIRDLSLQVRSGQTLALLGPNGAGKSTVLQLMAGILRPNRGEIRVMGRSVLDRSARRVVGFAGHRSGLYGHLTAIENLRFYADLYGIDYHNAEKTLQRFDLGDDSDVPVRLLSRGLVQRLSLARALLHDPQIILLDEPFTGLDAAAAARLRETMADLRARERAIVMATHAWSEASELGDSAVVLIRGRMAVHESARAITPERLVTLYAQTGSGVRGPGSEVAVPADGFE